MVQSQQAGSSFEVGTVRVGLRETVLWQNVTHCTKLSTERTEVKEGKKDENRHCLSSDVIFLLPIHKSMCYLISHMVRIFAHLLSIIWTKVSITRI